MKCVSHSFLCLALAAGAFSNFASASPEAAENKLRDRVDPVTADFVDTDVRLKLFSTETSATRSPFHPVVNVSPGYATNPSLESIATGAYFLGASVALGYERADPAARTVFSAGYEVSGLFFERGADSNNEIDQVVSFSFQKEFSNGLQIRFGASDTQVDVDYTSLLNVAAVGLDVRTRLADNLFGGFTYTQQYREALLPVTNVRQDPDAVRRIPAVFFGTDLSRYGTGLPQVTVTYANYWNLADGSDEDYEANRVALRAVNWRLGEGLSLDVEASYEDRAGENFSTRFTGLTRRDDILTKASVGFNHAMMSLRDTKVALVVGYERSESNLASANYDGWTFAYSFTKSF